MFCNSFRKMNLQLYFADFLFQSERGEPWQLRSLLRTEADSFRVGNSLFGFRVNHSFFESETAFRFCRSFAKERREEFPLLQIARRAMKSYSLFCFGHKKENSRVKRTNFKFSFQRPLLKRVNHALKERIALSLFLKEQQERKSESPNLVCLIPRKPWASFG